MDGDEGSVLVRIDLKYPSDREDCELLYSHRPNNWQEIGVEQNVIETRVAHRFRINREMKSKAR